MAECTTSAHGSSLLTAFRARVSSHPHGEAVRFLERGDVDGPQQALSYAELDGKARAWAAELQRRGTERSVPLRGERIVLLHPQSLDLVVALFACFYAGAVPVVCPAPPKANLRRKLDRLRAIVSDCRPSWILGTADLASRRSDIVAHAPELADAEWLATSAHEVPDSAGWIEPTLRSDSLAFLQYSSGSTGNPKGVMVSHGAVLGESSMAVTVMGPLGSSVVIWTPLFHDMGLATLLYVLAYGGRVILFSATAFAQRPARWLEAINRFRADRSGAPNFAYEMCVEQVSAQECEGLDLSCWEVAFCGAEPVRASTLRRFAAAFARCGFRERALAPAYGLAEATCLVTMAARRQAPPRVISAARDALQAASQPLLLAASHEQIRVELCSVGGAIDEQQIRIVDPVARVALAEGAVGEIWLRGANICSGYWGREEETRTTFGAQLAGEPGCWLRTGDLGALRDSELYVVGRIKDLIVIRGRNFYPQDLEQVATFATSKLDIEGVAAVALEGLQGEALGIIAEVGHRLLRSANVIQTLPRITEAIRRSLVEALQIAPARIALVRAGDLLRTTSGKVRRAELRRGLIDGTLPTLHVWDGTRELSGSIGVLGMALTKAVECGEDLIPGILEFLAEQLRAESAVTLDATSALAEIPIESLRLISLRARIEQELDIQMSTERLFELWQHARACDLAEEIATLWLDRYLARNLSGERTDETRSLTQLIL